LTIFLIFQKKKITIRITPDFNSLISITNVEKEKKVKKQFLMLFFFSIPWLPTIFILINREVFVGRSFFKPVLMMTFQGTF